MRTTVLLLLLIGTLSAANFRLYLKDGSFHMVREYKVEDGRVRYYSTERSEWEEIPVELADLGKTASERAAKEEREQRDAAEQDAEDKAERELAREVGRVPIDPGVYWLNGKELSAFKQADVKLVKDKRRQAIKMITQIPFNGKGTMEIAGERSTNVIREPRPEFYFRMNQDERLILAKLEVKKGSRIVERVEILPVDRLFVENFDVIESFRRQFQDGLFKIWPVKDLLPGEYAIVQYTEGKGSPQVWDFRIE
jgi:hypothetical protein